MRPDSRLAFTGARAIEQERAFSLVVGQFCRTFQPAARLGEAPELRE